MRSDVYGLLPVLTRQRLHGFAADFFDEDFVRAHHLVHAGTSRSPEKALIAVGERCSLTPETRPEAILAYSLLLHVELSGQGSCGSPAYAALLKPAWHETDIFLQPDQEWLEPELFESPPHGMRIAAILQALASLEFSLGESRKAYATASAAVWKSTTKSSHDAAVLVPSSDEEPASPRHRAGVASMEVDATIQHEGAVNF